MNLLAILLNFLFLALIKSDDLACTDCQCAASDDSTTFARGDTAIICAQFLTVNGTSGEILGKRASFPVTVDTFSSIQLSGGQVALQDYDYIALVVQAHGTTMTTNLTFVQRAQYFYSSVFSVVVQISSGTITGVIWDHRCATCESSECYKFSMANGTFIDSLCNNSTCISTNDSSCDPQIYVSWIGSDKNSLKMTSAGTRLSLFRQFSSSDLLSANTIPAYVVPSDESDTSTDNSTTDNSTTDNSTSDNSTTDNSTTDNSTSDNSTTDNSTSTDSSSGSTDSSTDSSSGSTDSSTDSSSGSTDSSTTDSSSSSTDTSSGSSNSTTTDSTGDTSSSGSGNITTADS